jgi:hypothetical protein
MGWEYSDTEYIKLFRKLVNWEWYSDTPTRSVFIHCLLKANWKPTTWHGIDMKRGEFIQSNENMAKELDLSVQQIRTAFQHLINSDSISFRKAGKYRIINVSKYIDYQAVNSKSTVKSTAYQQRTNSKLTADIRTKEHIRSKEENIESSTPVKTLEQIMAEDDEGMTVEEYMKSMEGKTDA